jgi:hypothetical protein
MIRLDAPPALPAPLKTPRKWTWRRVAAWQGAYYAATGVWALSDMRSFQFVTGRKKDTWLVKTVGALVLASGGALLQASRERERQASIFALGALSAVAFAAIDFTYVAKRRISPVYALDGIAEVAIAGMWLATCLDGDGPHSLHPDEFTAPHLKDRVHRTGGDVTVAVRFERDGP